jgi:hypothetical protein
LVLAAARLNEVGLDGPTEGLRLLDLDHPGAGKRVSGSAAPRGALRRAARLSRTVLQVHGRRSRSA